MTEYRTIDGDMIDEIAFRHYGRQDMVERVYDANPGLATRGPVLPSGVIVFLPEADPRTVNVPIRLWGRSA
ncbi:P2-like prophage tail protein X [Roseivivax halotolerans]|uniref:P2-like prophage tail protein X n=1 Tax=Roseivivax halotolerans TaxID=93684 RepID=A0A1I5W4K4_9RHOB|nr:tail protein X [Roseivivax halotolerans]SFQ14684.1 P2-like prophage tail protein X [Roseivivax halotolerans]